eukprot:Stramenopile-MAST_4_protein_2389
MSESSVQLRPEVSWRISELLKRDESALEFFSETRNVAVKTGLPYLDACTRSSTDIVEINSGMLSGQIVCFQGGHGSGKSELLMLATVQCALRVEFGGNGSSVVYFSLDNKLDISRLKAIVKFAIIASSSPLLKEAKSNSEELNRHVKDTLSRVHVVPCSSPQDLALGLIRLSMDTAALDKTKLLVLDGIGTYFYTNKLFEKSCGSSLLSAHAFALQQLVQRGTLLVLAGEQTIFANASPSSNGYMSRLCGSLRLTIFLLKPAISSTRFLCHATLIHAKGRGDGHSFQEKNSGKTEGFSFSVDGRGVSFPDHS